MYELIDPTPVPSPALLYYPDLIAENIQKAIQIGGGAHRLWPHVKTHKSADVVQMQQAAGIHRFKCATVAEAEMLAVCGAQHILMAYPLVGPAVARFISLMQKFRCSEWWAIGDNAEALAELNRQAAAAHLRPNLLIDVNMGMNRTGVPLETLSAFCQAQTRHANLHLRGLHCYDGHITFPDPTERKKAAAPAARQALEISNALRFDTVILGGTPTFPCHAPLPEAYLSPGTLFINDHGYASRYPDLPFTPAAALLTRVVSHPAPGLFTLDLGYKAISADPTGPRGRITTLPEATPVAHSEEHWTFRHDPVPPIATPLCVVPTHICSTTALHEEILPVRNGRIIETWQVTARNRRLTV